MPYRSLPPLEADVHSSGGGGNGCQEWEREIICAEFKNTQLIIPSSLLEHDVHGHSAMGIGVYVTAHPDPPNATLVPIAPRSKLKPRSLCNHATHDWACHCPRPSSLGISELVHNTSKARACEREYRNLAHARTILSSSWVSQRLPGPRVFLLFDEFSLLLGSISVELPPVSIQTLLPLKCSSDPSSSSPPSQVPSGRRRTPMPPSITSSTNWTSRYTATSPPSVSVASLLSH